MQAEGPPVSASPAAPSGRSDVAHNECSLVNRYTEKLQCVTRERWLHTPDRRIGGLRARNTVVGQEVDPDMLMTMSSSGFARNPSGSGLLPSVIPSSMSSAFPARRPAITSGTMPRHPGAERQPRAAVECSNQADTHRFQIDAVELATCANDLHGPRCQ
jgi:hypothetical protein